MRRRLGTALPALLLTGLLAAGLAGCGDEDGGSASDDATTSGSGAGTSSAASSASPSASPGESTSSSPSGPVGTADGAVEFELVGTVTETEAGGTAATQAVALPDEAALADFVVPFSDSLQAQVRQLAASVDVPGDQRLYGAVVALGCDAPDRVTVTANSGALQIVALKVPEPQVQCFAAMTTVALVLVPAEAVP